MIDSLSQLESSFKARQSAQGSDSGAGRGLAVRMAKLCWIRFGPDPLCWIGFGPDPTGLAPTTAAPPELLTFSKSFKFQNTER